MPELNYTPSQRAAIESEGSTLLVSAGAGSGKTRVLTERLMDRVCRADAPADLDRFLINTFTRAAAGELKSRISGALAQALAADPGNRRLRRQSALCRRAQIGTIHSFCTTLLRENSQALALSPDFRILDEERAESMKRAALERVLEDWYDAPEEHPGFLLLADTVGAGRDDRRLGALVLELHKKMQSHARPEQWAEEQIAQMERAWTDAGETPWGRELLDWAAARADYWARELERLMAAVRHEPKLLAYYEQRLPVTAEGLREFLRCVPLGWDRASAACREIAFPDFRGLRSPDPALSAHVKARRDACKESVKAMALALEGGSAELLEALRRTTPAMNALLRLALAFDERYARDKRRQSLLDFARAHSGYVVMAYAG